MTGGDVVMSTSAEAVCIFGRVSSAGAKVAPSNGSGLWVSAKTGTGTYSVTFAQSYPQYLGAQITLEAAGQCNCTFSATTRILSVATFAADGTTATDKAFSFQANFTESLAP